MWRLELHLKHGDLEAQLVDVSLHVEQLNHVLLIDLLQKVIRFVQLVQSLL